MRSYEVHESKILEISGLDSWNILEYSGFLGKFLLHLVPYRLTSAMGCGATKATKGSSRVARVLSSPEQAQRSVGDGGDWSGVIFRALVCLFVCLNILNGIEKKNI